MVETRSSSLAKSAEVSVLRQATVLDAWHKSYLTTTIDYPELVSARNIFVGNTLLKSLINNETDLSYVDRSQLTPDQIKTSKRTMIIFHDKFNVEELPQERTNTILDTRFQDIWTGVKDTTLLTIATSMSLPNEFDIPEDVTQLQKKPEYQGTLDALAILYTDAAAILESTEAKELGARRKTAYTSGNSFELDDIQAKLETKIISEVTKRKTDARISSHHVNSFLATIMS